MAATLTPWILGKNCTSLIIQGVTVDNAGVLTVNATQRELFGLLQQVRFIQRANSENISPMDRPVENNVPIETATDIEVTELMKYTAGRILRTVVNLYSFVKITVIQAGQTITYYGSIGTNEETWPKGATTGTALFRMVDTNEANPNFSPALS